MKTSSKVLAFLLTSILTFSAAAQITDVVKKAVSDKGRAESDISRDAKRKPAEVLALLGVQAGEKVIDLNAGGGYYTDLLSRIVGEKGQVITHNSPFVINRFANYFLDKESGWPKKLASKQWQTNVTPLTEELDTMSYPLPIDRALMVLFYHDTIWQGVDRRMMNQHLYNALKPGGVYMIIDHSAEPGSKARDNKTLHRIDKQFVIDELIKVGFVLETDSNILANPKDSRDYNVFRDYKTNRDSTDRFVLKFVKPII